MGKICYIIGAADPGKIRIAANDGDIVIAADAGYRHLAALGTKADLVLGDFDSLGFVPDDAEIIRHPVRKDDTDTMLAAREGMRRGYRTFVFIGCTGGKRPDHTLANLQTLLWLAERGADAYLVGDGHAYAAVRNGAVCFESDNRGTVSVFCFGQNAVGVYERGLSYTLEDAELTSGFPLGVSNSFIGERAEVGVKDGSLIIFWETDADKFLRTVRLNEKT